MKFEERMSLTAKLLMRAKALISAMIQNKIKKTVYCSFIDSHDYKANDISH